MFDRKRSIDRKTGATSASGIDRREFLGGLAALGVSALLPGCASDAGQSALAGGKPHRIDGYPGGKSAIGLVVAVRLSESGPVG